MLSDSYLRKSTVDAGKSVARQERDWRNDCATNGFTPGRAFIDPDLSASRYARKARPDYAALVEHIRSGGCQMLSLWEASRGSRDMGEWVALLDLCRKHGVLIRIFGGDPETFDPRKQRDREALLREGINAESESDTIARRARDGARDLAYAGKPPGPLLYGYTRTYDERGKLKEQTIHAERAAIVRRCAQDTLRGVSLNSQAQRLNDAGITSPQGGLWTGHGIARMLMNPGYVGKRIHNGEIIGDAVWPALLTAEDHTALCVLLRTPGRRIHADSTLAHELSGAATCGVCGSVLRTLKASRYLCLTRGCMKVSAAIEPMDRLVGDMMCARLSRSDAAAVFAPAVDDAALAAAKKELDELKAHLAGFVEQAAMRKLSAESLAAVEAGIKPQIEEAQRRVRALSTPPTLAKYAGIDVAAEWPNLEPAVRREFILALASVVLSPVGKGGRWSIWRLGGSRWHGDALTWGEHWRRDGYAAS